MKFDTVMQTPVGNQPEASRARIAAIVSRIRVEGEQIQMVLDDSPGGE